jgi:hypothetical protein
MDEITRLPGLGPKRARQLFDELGIDSLEALRAAAEGQRIRSLRGFGPKAEERILAAIDGPNAEAISAGPTGTAVSTSSAAEVAGSVEVFNASPVDVVVWSNGSVVGEVPSLRRVEQAWPATGSVEVRPANVESDVAPVRVLERAAVGAQAVISPGDFRSVRLDGAAVSAVFVNDMGVYVDVYGVDEAGSASLAASAVAPGGRHQQQSHPGGCGWSARRSQTSLRGCSCWAMSPPSC